MYRFQSDSVVKLVYDDVTESHFILAMEYCNGGDLYQLMAQIRKRVFTEAEVQKILKKILEGMKALQQQNVAHRDLKPENFVLNFPEMPSNLTEQAKREYQRNFDFLKNDNWELKLIDFGFAK